MSTPLVAAKLWSFRKDFLQKKLEFDRGQDPEGFHFFEAGREQVAKFGSIVADARRKECASKEVAESNAAVQTFVAGVVDESLTCHAAEAAFKAAEAANIVSKMLSTC